MTYLIWLAAMQPADNGGGSDPLSALLQYGPLGILCVLFLTGLVVTGKQYAQVLEENKRLQQLIDDKVYPTIEANTKATERAIELVVDLARQPPRRSSVEWDPR